MIDHPARSIFNRGLNNSGHIAHELAHCFGHKTKDGKKLYDLYFKALPNRCKPTRYARTGNRNEEFAEVFALYLMNPDELHKYEECKPALQFFSEVFNENLPTEEITCENRRNKFNQYGHFDLSKARSNSSTGTSSGNK